MNNKRLLLKYNKLKKVQKNITNKDPKIIQKE